MSYLLLRETTDQVAEVTAEAVADCCAMFRSMGTLRLAREDSSSCLKGTAARVVVLGFLAAMPPVSGLKSILSCCTVAKTHMPPMVTVQTPFFMHSMQFIQHYFTTGTIPHVQPQEAR